MSDTSTAPDRRSAVAPYAWAGALGSALVALFLAQFGSTGMGGRLIFAAVCLVCALAARVDVERGGARGRAVAPAFVVVAALVAALAGVLPARDGSVWDDVTTLAQVAGCVAMISVAAAIGAVAFFQLDLAAVGPVGRRPALAVLALTAAGSLATASLLSPGETAGLLVAGAMGLVAGLVAALEPGRLRGPAVVCAAASLACVSEAGLSMAHSAHPPVASAVRIAAPLLLLAISTTMTAHLPARARVVAEAGAEP